MSRIFVFTVLLAGLTAVASSESPRRSFGQAGPGQLAARDKGAAPPAAGKVGGEQVVAARAGNGKALVAALIAR